VRLENSLYRTFSLNLGTDKKCSGNRPTNNLNYPQVFTIPAYLWTGPNLAGARPQAKPLVRAHLPLLRGKIGKAF